MYELSLENFTGPLDLLLELIKKNKFNILDIPIAKITDDYLSYIDEHQEVLDSVSDFVLLASYLVFLKSKELIPNKNKRSTPELDDILDGSRDEKKNFAYILLRYSLYKELAKSLSRRASLFNKEFKSAKRNIKLFDKIDNVENVFRLASYAFIPNAKELKKTTRKDDIKEDIMEIVSKYPDGFVNKDIFSLKQIKTIEDIVSIFLVVLELSRLAFVKLKFKDTRIYASTVKPLSLLTDYALGESI